MTAVTGRSDDIETYACRPSGRRTWRSLARGGDFAALVELRGRWLPGQASANELRRPSAKLSLPAAARMAATAHIRIQHLHGRMSSYEDWKTNCWSVDRSKITYCSWRWTCGTVISQTQQAAAISASKELPNPFRAGDPLSPEGGREVFRGRDELVQQIGTYLADPRDSVSIVLQGPRTCGKSSWLCMLPTLLPDTICGSSTSRTTLLRPPEASCAVPTGERAIAT